MSYTLLSEKTRTARTTHRCIWCGQYIMWGDSHIEERSVYDGQFQHHRWHFECRDEQRRDVQDGGDVEFTPWSQERPQ